MQDSLKRRLQQLRSGTLTNRMDQVDLANDVMEEMARLERVTKDAWGAVAKDIRDSNASVDIVGVE
jgi:hypothetical protein